jgi:hypothetical protein
MTATRRDASAVLVLGFLAAALSTQNADAQSGQRSADKMVPACQQLLVQPKQNTLASAFDLGICTGLLEGLIYMSEYLPPDRRPCYAKNVTPVQIVRVILAYIEGRPQRMHEDFRELAIEALHDAWPCN